MNDLKYIYITLYQRRVQHGSNAQDKWKTLVHTAKISPQQRRGEPVPQELLDRVLDAHAYWSLQQAKQQLKHQRETRLFLELEPAAHNRN